MKIMDSAFSSMKFHKVYNKVILSYTDYIEIKTYKKQRTIKSGLQIRGGKGYSSIEFLKFNIEN